MTIYVALLRGINVGGSSKVEMHKLRAAFESLGFKNVSTYINSGNVIFQDSRKQAELVTLIEETISRTFGLDLRIVLRDLANIRELVKKIPGGWTNNGKQKTDVLFLWQEIDNPEILQKVVINPKLENVLYVSGALVWNIARENVTRGGGIKLIETDIYPLVTARNINTVRKLYNLMGKL